MIVARKSETDPGAKSMEKHLLNLKMHWMRLVASRY